jgi:single-strand DNA-binding protein
VETVEAGDAVETDAPVARNEVCLTGRLGAAPDKRALPSGDVLVSFRVVVGRPPPGRGARERAPTVDTIECAAWRGDVRRIVLGWSPGDVVEVTGALRRRFWRGGAGTASRTEVEVLRAKRVAKAAPPGS